jgi:hypothetical protein
MRHMSRRHSRTILCSVMLAATFSVAPALAQGVDWGQWEDAVKGGGASEYPGSKCHADPQRLKVRHAHWVCMHIPNTGNTGCPSEYCWQGRSEAIYTCPDGGFMRTVEKIRYTKVPCGKADWQQTQYYSSLYPGETWAAKFPGPDKDPDTRSTPPTENDQLPAPPSGGTVSWGSGLPEELEQQAKDDPKNPANQKTAKTESNPK